MNITLLLIVKYKAARQIRILNMLKVRSLPHENVKPTTLAKLHKINGSVAAEHRVELAGEGGRDLVIVQREPHKYVASVEPLLENVRLIQNALLLGDVNGPVSMVIGKWCEEVLGGGIWCDLVLAGSHIKMMHALLVTKVKVDGNKENSLARLSKDVRNIIFEKVIEDELHQPDFNNDEKAPTFFTAIPKNIREAVYGQLRDKDDELKY